MTALLVATVNSEHNLVTMYKEDGSHWFTLDLAVTQRNLETMTETMKIYYEDPHTGKYANDMFQDTGILINPHSWYHICMGLDTVSGLLRIVVNGMEVVNMEKEYFKNSATWKPTSLEGHILQFKAYLSGFWIQHRNTFSNMNIFISCCLLVPHLHGT